MDAWNAWNAIDSYDTRNATENTEFQLAYKNLIADADKRRLKPMSLLDAISWDLRVLFFKLKFRKELAMTDCVL